MSKLHRSLDLRRGLAVFALACLFAPVLPAQEPVAPVTCLEQMRAGGATLAGPLDAGERGALERAEAAAPALAAMRAGGLHLTDEELRLVLITAGVVIILAILI